MPPSHPAESGGSTVAILAESLYLLNLLLLPGLAFIGLLILNWRTSDDSPVAVAHLQQTIAASLWAGGILVGINLMIIALGGYQAGWVWVVVILYFTLCHATLVIFGAYGLAKAINGQCWRFPLVGRPLPRGCS